VTEETFSIAFCGEYIPVKSLQGRQIRLQSLKYCSWCKNVSHFDVFSKGQLVLGTTRQCPRKKNKHSHQVAMVGITRHVRRKSGSISKTVQNSDIYNDTLVMTGRSNVTVMCGHNAISVVGQHGVLSVDKWRRFVALWPIQIKLNQLV